MTAPSGRGQVPWATIRATAGIVLATVVVLALAIKLERLLIQLVIAAFLAAVLAPAVRALQRGGLPRLLATTIVFASGFVVLAALGYMFLHPVIREASRLASDLPAVVDRAQAGQGPIGHVVKRFHLEKQVRAQLPHLRQQAAKSGAVAVSLLRRLFAGVVGVIIILLLTYLMLLEGPGMASTVLAALSDHRAARLRRLGVEIRRTVSGYVLGNLATSLIAGVVCGIALLIMGVPFALVFAVWVGLVDLLPLVGGLLAGVPTVGFAFLHSLKAGIVLAVVFLIYQQLENHALNPLIMSRTVRLNPLWVLLSVLLGAEMLGFVGALLAIPAAGAIQVVARDIWVERHGGLRPVGAPPS